MIALVSAIGLLVVLSSIISIVVGVKALSVRPLPSVHEPEYPAFEVSVQLLDKTGAAITAPEYTVLSVKPRQDAEDGLMMFNEKQISFIAVSNAENEIYPIIRMNGRVVCRFGKTTWDGVKGIRAGNTLTIDPGKLFMTNSWKKEVHPWCKQQHS